MYTLSYWRSHLGIVADDFLHKEPATIVGDPYTAHVTGEVAKVSRMSDVHPKFLEKSPRFVRVDLLHQEPAAIVGVPFTAHVPGVVTQVSRMTDVHPKFLKKSPK